MNNAKKRIISLLLVLSMAMGLAGSALAAEQSAPSDQPTADSAELLPDQDAAVSGEEGQSEGDASSSGQEDVPQAGQTGEEAESTPEEPEASAPVEQAEADPTETDQPEADAPQPEADASPAEEANAPEEAQAEAPGEEDLTVQEEEEPEVFTLNITETISLEKEYDDRFTFTEAKDGCVVAQIRDQAPTSSIVSKGKVTGNKDKAVVQLAEDSDTDAVAVGVGTATVLMVKREDLSEAKKLLGEGGTATRSVDAVQVDLVVKPAPLTILFLGGQSNMEGFGSNPGHGKKSTYPHPEQSIVCPEGEVYSTYAPSLSAVRSTQANGIGGYVKFKGYCTTGTASQYVAGSLTSDRSVGNTTLIYPINQMTAAGDGKNGPDSGLAYEWNRLTGEKVWTVNAAWGGSTSAQWLPSGGACYARAKAVFSNALQVYKAEISAGHYTQAHKLYFWLQGETDSKKLVKASKYLSNFDKMRKGMKQLLGYEKLGIISVRGSVGNHYRNARDLSMTGPRVAQTYLSNTKAYNDVCIVSDVNEQWVSNNGVKKYFQRTYGSALSYPTHGKTPALPTKVSQVHNDIHYMQVAHNENGLTAARGMYQWMTGTAKATGVKWRNADGQSVASLNLSKGQTTLLSPAVVNVAASKSVRWKFSSGLKYNSKTGSLKVTKNGQQQIQALDAEGNVISTLVVSKSGSLAAPTLKKASNVSGKKIGLQWSKVAGASGYQVQYSVNADFSGAKSAKVKSGGTVKATLKNLGKKTYYVRLRAYKGGSSVQYSAWSATKKVMVSK